MSSFNIDLATEYVRNIYDSFLCGICGKPNLPHFRYYCGHTVCKNCVNISEGCYNCMTPTELSATPEYDATLTQQVKNVCHLIHTFKEAFNIDVFKRKRASDNLKIEKEVFPFCIQAPLKYYNKRKSYHYSYSGKENNNTKFLGEDISPLDNNKMENTVSYVQNWLNKNINNQKRKPLSDINIDNSINTGKSSNTNLVTNSLLNIKKHKNNPRKQKKRSIKAASAKMQNSSTLDKCRPKIKHLEDPTVVPIEIDSESYKTEIKQICDAQKGDESGIVIDYNSSILIEDSQLSVGHDVPLINKIIDKDKNALLEVLKASKKGDNIIVNTTTLSKVVKQDTKKIIINNLHKKVPFYKMSYLQENCFLCCKDISVQNISSYESKCLPKGVHVNINSNNFTATIKVNSFQNLVNYDKKISMAIQTDIIDINNFYESDKDSKYIHHFSDTELDTKLTQINSQKVFTSLENHEIYKNTFDRPITKFENIKNVIIEESDSSEDIELSSVFEVTADIHDPRKPSEYEILTTVENIEEHKLRSRRRPRGHTPDSSNSSDKENYDPNRSKKSKTSKKSCFKK